MDLDKIIRNLHEERLRLTQIIASLEKLQQRASRTEEAKVKKRRGRKFMDAKGRREVSERMKKYWAQRRAAGKDKPPKGA
jgi:hypothetical protein